MLLKKIASFIIGAALSLPLTAQNISRAADKFKSAIATIDMAYVDSVDEEKITETAIIGMLQELDPHSVYISKEDLEEMNEPLIGNFDGIGVEFQIMLDTIMVVSAIPGGPSEKLGIAAGDKIIKIEGENVAGTGIKNNDVLKKLRGNKGTKVNVTILRTGAKNPMEFTITRDKIPLFSINATYMATPSTGYIKLNRFAQNTMDEIQAALTELKAKGMENLILDLRGNGGGYLHIAIALADEFLGDKKLIVYTEGVKQPKQEAFSTTRGNFEKGKLVILINENSASASEIVSGAVQDWDRGIIVGRRSFGKGLVQKPFNLSDGSVIRLTTARYYTPTGRSIQKPYAEGTEAYYQDINQRFKHGEHIYADSIKLPDSLKFYTANKRLVYGGGGIMPDIFIPLDTTAFTDYYSKLVMKDLFNRFILNYLDKNRSVLSKKYSSVTPFKKEFVVSEEMFNDFLAYAEKNEVKKVDADLARSKADMKIQLRGLIARHLWNLSAYYEVVNEENDDYKKALEVLKDNTFEKLHVEY